MTSAPMEVRTTYVQVEGQVELPATPTISRTHRYLCQRGKVYDNMFSQIVLKSYVVLNHIMDKTFSTLLLNSISSSMSPSSAPQPSGQAIVPQILLDALVLEVEEVDGSER